MKGNAALKDSQVTGNRRTRGNIIKQESHPPSQITLNVPVIFLAAKFHNA
tara:strand:+ start:2236 stop:2385 length:150 start_codon:yes stop_codon:yes gene_type:complete